jgi:serine/threonine-protein kinase
MAEDRDTVPQRATARRDLVGTTLVGRYRVTRKLGQGGMGAVYEAIHTKLDKRVAIKILLERFSDHASVVERFEREARLASSIGHPHIIDIADVGADADGHTFIVMELLEGETLAQLIARSPALPERRVVQLVAQAARALAAVHGNGIVHRDIKPANLFVLDRGGDFVKVLDFGISKLAQTDPNAPQLTETGAVLGTAAYMAPEQARGEPADHHTDIYALGVVLYEAATGVLPFAGDNDLKILDRVISAAPRPLRELRPELSEAFEQVVLRAMARDPGARFASAAALAEALEALAAGHAPTATSAMRPAAAAPRTPRRRLAPVAFGAGAVALVAAGLLVHASRGSRDDTVAVTIVSEPSGAIILRDDRVLGPTPLQFRFQRGAPVIQLTAQMAGYDIACVKVDPAVDHDIVPVRMPGPGTGCGNSTTRPVWP